MKESGASLDFEVGRRPAFILSLRLALARRRQELKRLVDDVARRFPFIPCSGLDVASRSERNSSRSLEWTPRSGRRSSRSLERTSRSVELTARSEERSSRSVELTSRSAEHHARSAEPSSRSVELPPRPARHEGRSADPSSRSLELASRPGKRSSRLANLPDREWRAWVLQTPIGIGYAIFRLSGRSAHDATRGPMRIAGARMWKAPLPLAAAATTAPERSTKMPK